MSKRLGLLVMVVLLLCTASAVVSAKELPLAATGGYVIVPSHASGEKPLTVYDSITQGETNWETQQISSYTNSLNVDLDWGNPSNSLQLTIYSPDGDVFGPYYDSSDGSTNGQIDLSIQNSNGIAEGTWLYKVYGYSVTGTQTYSI